MGRVLHWIITIKQIAQYTIIYVPMSYTFKNKAKSIHFSYVRQNHKDCL